MSSNFQLPQLPDDRKAIGLEAARASAPDIFKEAADISESANAYPNLHIDGLLSPILKGENIGAEIHLLPYSGTEHIRPTPLSDDGKPAQVPKEKSTADGYGEVIEGAKLAPEFSRGLGYAAGSLIEKGAPILESVRKQIPWIAGPLTAAKGAVDTYDQVKQGAPADEAIVGNAVRSGLVIGATLLPDGIPFVGPLLGMGADMQRTGCCRVERRWDMAF